MDMQTPSWPETDIAEIPAIFARLAARAPELARTTAAERIAKLRRLYQAVYDHRAEIAEAGFEEIGSNGIMSLLPLKADVDYTCDHLGGWMQDSVPEQLPALMGRRAYVIHEPKGVVLHLSTWNSPVLISLSPMVSAIAAGNAVLIKPSEVAPHAADIVRRIIEAVFPADEVAVVTGGIPAATKLLEQPFNHICYVGNNRVGRIVMRAAAEHFANVTLEMGGKNPAIIDDSADIADAANKIAFGTTMLGGQICLAPDYILTPQDKLQATVEALKTSFTNFFNPEGKGFAASADYPRIVNLHHVQRIGRLIEDAVSKGAKIVYGGQIDFQQRLITPTIITGMTEDMEIFQEEIFGPVITVQGYAAREDVFAEINKRPKPLGVYVFAGNEAAARFFLNGTRGGSSCVNNVFLQANVPSMPFGGCNHSGIGRLNGHAGFLEFSNQRGVVQDAFDPASGPPMFYPPFPEMAATFVEQMLTPS